MAESPRRSAKKTGSSIKTYEKKKQTVAQGPPNGLVNGTSVASIEVREEAVPIDTGSAARVSPSRSEVLVRHSYQIGDRTVDSNNMFRDQALEDKVNAIQQEFQ